MVKKLKMEEESESEGALRLAMWMLFMGAACQNQVFRKVGT